MEMSLRVMESIKMKITKSQLKRLIQEELSQIKEADGEGLYAFGSGVSNMTAMALRRIADDLETNQIDTLPDLQNRIQRVLDQLESPREGDSSW